MEGRNEQTEIEKHTSDKHATQQIVRDMEGQLKKVYHISGYHCIYRVPKNLRYINEDAYVPRLVSLGPFHHGNEGLKTMEDHKLRCFDSFIKVTKINLVELVSRMKINESKARGFYAEYIGLSSEEFVKVMLVDAIFVIILLLDRYSSVRDFYHKDFINIYHDYFINSHVFRDMMLLENQLPFFILEEILDFAKRTNGTSTTITNAPSITELTHSLFEDDKNHEGVIGLGNYSEVTHFVDFERFLYLPEGNRKIVEFEEIESITKLYKAGVIFEKASEKKKLFDIDFVDGVLYIPSITVSDITETIFRNLLAYEQCHHGSSRISDYFALMGMLIDTSDDVELLVTNGILKNDLSSNQEVAKVFNNLEKEIAYDSSNYYYSEVCKKINDHSGISWHTWMATLKHNYLSTPWKFLSVFAACFLLVLTVIQTVYSVI